MSAFVKKGGVYAKETFPNGFFMNWFGAMTSEGKPIGEGFEFHLLVIAIGIALMIRGGGKWSIDKAIADGMK